MKTQGYTLIDVITVLSVIAICLSYGIPKFSEQLQQLRTRDAAYSLQHAINNARAQAVARNQRSVLIPHQGDWHQGMQLFIDSNNNGHWDDGEELLQEFAPLKGVSVRTNTPVQDYISFIGSGEGRKAGRANGGALLIGTLEICPAHASGGGYALVLARGGRLRMETRSGTDCTEAMGTSN